MKIGGNNLQEATDNLLALRRHFPFKYSGKWFVFMLGDQAHAVRSMKTVRKAAQRAQAQNTLVYTIGE